MQLVWSNAWDEASGFSMNIDFILCGSRKYPYPPPPPHRRDLPYDPPSPLDFPKSAPKIYPPPLPSGISKIFAHPLEILLSLIEVNKEVVLFTRMPNFVSFIYCIRDKRIPYANSFICLMRSSQRQILCISCNFC